MVKEIISLDQYSNIIKEFKSRHGKVDTNNYFMQDSIEQYILENRIHYVLSDEILYFFMDEYDYSKLIFYLPVGKAASLVKIRQTVLIDFVFRKNKKMIYVEMLCSKWQECGFREYKSYQKMILYVKKKEILENLLPELCEEFVLGNNDISCAEPLLDLWRNGLDEKSTPLPGIDEIRDCILRKEILYIKSRNGDLCGAIRYVQTGKTFNLHHLVISQKYRRKKLGKYLMEMIIHKAIEIDIDYCKLWVDIKNKAAIELYLKCGYVLENIYSKQIILNEK